MPFTPGDAAKHKKGLSTKQAERWAAIANNVLDKCDPITPACEGRAIRIANARSVKGEPMDLLNVARLLFGDAEELAEARAIVGTKDMHGLQVEDSHPPLFAGGVTSFDELDRWRDFFDRITAARNVLMDAQALTDNLIELAQPGDLDFAAVEAVLEDIPDRVAAQIAGEKSAGGGILARIGALIGRKRDETIKAGDGVALRERLKSVKALADGARAGAIFAAKQADGRTRWAMLASTNVRDRDGEILTRAGQIANVAAMKQTGAYPEAWIAHVPGTRWGLADYAEYIDDVLVVSGLVDPGMEEVAQRLAAKTADLSVSHGFVKVRRSASDPRDLERWFTFEVSPLPRIMAAQPWLGLVMEGVMNDKQEKAIRDALGDGELANSVIAGTRAVAESTAGLDRKQAGDTDAEKDAAPAPMDMEAIQTLVREELKALVVAETKAAMQPLGEALSALTEDLRGVKAIAETLKQSDDEHAAAILTKARTKEPYVASKQAAASVTSETDPGAEPGGEGGGEGMQAEFMTGQRWMGRFDSKSDKEPVTA